MKGKLFDGHCITYRRDEQGRTWILTDLAQFPSRSDFLETIVIYDVSNIKDGL